MPHMIRSAMRPFRASGLRKLEMPFDTASSPVSDDPPFAKARRQ